MRIIRLRTHPTDPDITEAHTDPGSRHTMGRFEPARYNPDRRCYLIHADDLDNFKLWTRHNQLHLVDERYITATPGRRQPLPPPECGHCATPIRGRDLMLGPQLTPCPACDEPLFLIQWDPARDRHRQHEDCNGYQPPRPTLPTGAAMTWIAIAAAAIVATAAILLVISDPNR